MNPDATRWAIGWDHAEVNGLLIMHDPVGITPVRTTKESIQKPWTRPAGRSRSRWRLQLPAWNQSAYGIWFAVKLSKFHSHFFNFVCLFCFSPLSARFRFFCALFTLPLVFACFVCFCFPRFSSQSRKSLQNGPFARGFTRRASAH